MCKNKWLDIWSRKATVSLNDSGDEFSLFCELKKADGFDVAVGDEITYYKSFYDGWKEFYNKIII